MRAHLSHVAFFALSVVAMVSPSWSGDFVEDLAACAKAPINASSFAFSQSKKAAEFVVSHGECVPMVVGGDALLYGMSAGFIGLQNAGKLPSGAQACVDATLGQTSKHVAKVLTPLLNTQPMASFIPPEGKTKLIEIAQGETNDALYKVPGVGMVMDHISCACAVSSSGVDINELKAQLKGVVETVEGCKDLVGKLVSGVYNVAKGAYGAAKDAVNSFGCTLGLGGCDDDGPPFFCTGYFQMRDGGKTMEQIVAIFPKIFVNVPSQSQTCEKKYFVELEKRQVDKAMQDAESLGAAAALGFAFRWIPKCLDAECKGKISNLADAYLQDIQDEEINQIYKDFNIAKIAVDDKYGAHAKLAVAGSKHAIKQNLNAPVADRLRAFDCELLFKRHGQSLCMKQSGYQVCRGYVDDNVWHLCALEGADGYYSAGRALMKALRAVGCIPDEGRARGVSVRNASINLTAQCLSGRAYAQCKRFRAGGSRVVCSGPLRPVVFDPSRLDHMLAPGSVFIPGAPSPDQSTRNTPRGNLRNVEPQTPPSRLRTLRPVGSTLCAFDRGPRAGQRQDYPRLSPLPIGTPCRDGRGSSGHIIAP